MAQTSSEPDPRALWIEQALRLNERYLVEVVERFGLCPWARSARLGGQVDRRVSLQTDPRLEPALSALTAWSSRPDVEIGLLLFPRLALSRSEFQRFVGSLISADAERQGRQSSPFALAAFHPEVALDTSSADRLVPFLRRSPDPTVQVVRIAALERVRGDEVAGTCYVDPRNLDLGKLQAPAKTLRDRIAGHNLSTVRARAPEVEAALAAILADHDATRRRLPPLLDTESEG